MLYAVGKALRKSHACYSTLSWFLSELFEWMEPIHHDFLDDKHLGNAFKFGPKCNVKGKNSCQTIRAYFQDFLFFFNHERSVLFVNMWKKSQKILWAYLRPLDFQFHMILPCCLAILAFLPAVAIPTVAYFLPTVKKHRPALWPTREGMKGWGKTNFYKLSSNPSFPSFLYTFSLVTSRAHNYVGLRTKPKAVIIL